LNYEFEVINNEENVKRPEDGVNVVGMFLEGAKWNNVLNSLDESDPKVLFTRCPMMLFIPCKTTDFR
jgi:dynein heavy chain